MLHPLEIHNPNGAAQIENPPALSLIRTCYHFVARFFAAIAECFCCIWVDKSAPLIARLQARVIELESELAKRPLLTAAQNSQPFEIMKGHAEGLTEQLRALETRRDDLERSLAEKNSQILELVQSCI